MSERPLRSDAERNRRRILDAAQETFRERGLGVTLDDIAAAAGVGVGTVYRRFPDKDALIDALFEVEVGKLVALAEESARENDPWTGLVLFLERGLAMQAADRGLRELILGGARGRERVASVRARMAPVVGGIVARAQAAGVLRDDFAPQDMPILQMMLGSVIDVTREVEPELWRRHLRIVLDGMRAQPGPPTPLPVAALTFPQVDQTVSSWRPPAR